MLDGTPSIASIALPPPPVHLQSRQADVAQLVEQSIRNRQVIGSSPIVGSSKFFLFINCPPDCWALFGHCEHVSGSLNGIRCECVSQHKGSRTQTAPRVLCYSLAIPCELIANYPKI